MIGHDGAHFVASCGRAFGSYAEGAGHEKTCEHCTAARGRAAAPTLLSELESLRDELEARYDGAPDSHTLWMGPGLSALTQLLDGAGHGERDCRDALRGTHFNPSA